MLTVKIIPYILAAAAGAVGLAWTGPNVVIRPNDIQPFLENHPSPEISWSKPIAAAQRPSTQGIRSSDAVALSKAAQVDHLSITAPWAAYLLVRDCEYARRHESQGNPEVGAAEICGDITPAQVVSRLQLLEQAAAAGVHGAFYAFANEGATGYRLYSPEATDPEYERKLVEYQHIGAVNGDRDALMSLSFHHKNEGDMPKAIAYWYAYMLTDKPEGSMAKEALDLMLQHLPLEQQIKALSEGVAMTHRMPK